MVTKNKILEYFRLMRPQGAAQTASILLLGSLIMGQRDFSSLLILFIIGVLSHIHGFVLNDYADVEVDKKLSELEKKPLVSGIIPKQHAIIIIIITMPPRRRRGLNYNCFYNLYILEQLFF